MSLSVIIPSRNEEKIYEVIDTIEAIMGNVEIIISNDRYSKGKGWALREGLSVAKYDTICFIDGDMDIDPGEIVKLLLLMKERDADIVVGAKRMSGILSRKIISTCCRLFIRALFGIKVQTQTGIKVFKRKCLPEWNDDKFAFDIEIIYKATKNGYKIEEVPVDVIITSKMPIRSIVRFIITAINIRIKIWFAKGYANA